MAGRVTKGFPLMKNWKYTCFTINRSYLSSTVNHCESRHILKAGFTVRSFEADWANFEWDQDDHMEELWEKGEAGIDFDSTPRIIDPDHFQCMFLIMGCIFSVQQIVLLWDILTNKKLGFFKLMFSGLFSCLLITSVNLYLFSTVLWTPIFVNNGKWDIFRGEYEMNEKKLMNNKTVAFAIIGYGAVTSVIFIFVAMIRSLGNTFFLMMLNILLLTLI